MREKNLAVLGIAVAISLSLIGCGGEKNIPIETTSQVEVIEPTSEVVVETDVSKELGEELIIGEAELPVMVVPGENGKAVVVDGSLEEIEDEAAKQNISIMMGEIPDETSESLAETIPEYSDETLSAEQMEKIEDSIREYTDKQAEDIMNQVFGNEG